MRWVGLAIAILSIPIFAALIGRDRSKRDLAIMAIGLMTFMTGQWTPSVALYVWPLWFGTSKGIFISLIHSLAIALLATRPPGRYRIPFLPIMILYLATVCLSLAAAPNKVASVFSIIQLVQAMVVFVAVASELHRPSAIRALLIGLSAGLVFQAAYVIRLKLAGVVQAAGTMDHQNILGLMVELSLLPLIASVLEGERSKIIYAGILAGAICIAGSGSRGAMGFFAFSLILLILLSLLRRASMRKWQITALGVLASLAIVPFGFATLKERFGDSGFSTDERSRMVLEDAAASIAADYPLGAGANNFVVVANAQGYIGKAGAGITQATRQQPTHNAFLLARAETGWSGQIVLMLLLASLIYTSLATAFRYRNLPLSGVALGCATGVFAAALHSMFEYALHRSDVQTLFFIVAAMIVGISAISRRQKSVRDQSRAVTERSARLNKGHAPVPEISR